VPVEEEVSTCPVKTTYVVATSGLRSAMEYAPGSTALYRQGLVSPHSIMNSPLKIALGQRERESVIQ
jgi:hypothetical protein